VIFIKGAEEEKVLPQSGKDWGDGESSVLCYSNGTDCEKQMRQKTFRVIVAKKRTCVSSSFSVVSDPKKVLCCCGAAASSNHVAVMVSHK